MGCERTMGTAGLIIMQFSNCLKFNQSAPFFIAAKKGGITQSLFLSLNCRKYGQEGRLGITMPIDKRLASNPKKCLTGSVLAIRNAQGLLRCARLLVNQGERGAAASLAILASEEAIKSTVLFFAAIPIDEAVQLVPTLRNESLSPTNSDRWRC